ncbi:MAG: beta-(1-6) glucans synthase [Pseudorhodoplanes sp.]
MRLPAFFFSLSAIAVGALWFWLGMPVAMPPSPLASGEKLYCVSYAPFRDMQTPLVASTRIEPWQIDEDLGRLADLTDCVRTYSTEHGLDQVPEIARRHGLKVIQGLWLGGESTKNQLRIAETVALARQFPDVIRAIVVGNEVLLRGEMTPQALADSIRSVKAQAGLPVTYADVWEFWLRNPLLYDVVDFVTIHILPYWEDFPIPGKDAASHVDAIRQQVGARFPGKEILIGETGWPSAGRMREGALPSPAEQARVVQEVLAAAKRGQYRVNVIEAFDQPWKRLLEGTVGGHWGLFDAGTRALKFRWGEAVSNHPLWRWQMAGGFLVAALVFVAAWRRTGDGPVVWAGIATIAAAVGVTGPYAVANVPLESLGIDGWARSLAFAGLALAAPVAGAAALTRGVHVPAFAELLGRRDEPSVGGLASLLGWLLIGLSVLAVVAALGLVFDPRYRDFPFAPLTAATVPFLVLTLLVPRKAGRRGRAEAAIAAVLGMSAVYIAFNESVANWQSLWTCANFALLMVILWRVRDARS